MSSGGGNFASSLNPMAAIGTIAPSLTSGLGGFMSDLTGQSSIAQLQGQAASAQLGQQQGDRTTAMSLAAPTQAEIQQLQQAMAVNQQNIQQSQSLINSASPAIQAAGAQAASLMNGGSAAALAPIQNQRAQQRSALQQQLQSQLGPGYATSTAGIQAMNNFDQQTGNLMTNAQQSTLQQFLGEANQGYAFGANQQQQGFNNQLSGNSQQYGWQTGQINALRGTNVNPGLQYSGQLAQAGYNSANIMGLASYGQQNMGNISSMLGSGSSGGMATGSGTAYAGGAMDAGAPSLAGLGAAVA